MIKTECRIMAIVLCVMYRYGWRLAIPLDDVVTRHGLRWKLLFK